MVKSWSGSPSAAQDGLRIVTGTVVGTEINERHPKKRGEEDNIGGKDGMEASGAK